MPLSSVSYAAPLVLLNLAFIVLIVLRIRRFGWRPGETTLLAVQVFLLYALSVVLALAIHDSGMLLHWPEWLSAALLAPLAASATVLFREVLFRELLFWMYAATVARPIFNQVGTPGRRLGWGLIGLGWGFLDASGALYGNSSISSWSFPLYALIFMGMSVEVGIINWTITKREKKVK